MPRALIIASMLFISLIAANPVPPTPVNFQTDYVHKMVMASTGPQTILGHVWSDDLHNRMRSDFNQTNNGNSVAGQIYSFVNGSTSTVYSVITVGGNPRCHKAVNPNVPRNNSCGATTDNGIRVINNVRVEYWTQNCTHNGEPFSVVQMWTVNAPRPFQVIVNMEGYYSETDYVNWQPGAGGSNPAAFNVPSICAQAAEVAPGVQPRHVAHAQHIHTVLAHTAMFAQ